MTLATVPATRHAAVVGASLGGLAAANALQQTGWKVTVFERANSSLREKGSGLGYVNVPAWESLRQHPMIRRNRRASRAQGSFYYGDLWGFLYDGLPRGTVHFGKTITTIEGDIHRQPLVDGTPFDLVVLADGGFSMLRQHVLQDASPEYAGCVVWRGSIPVKALPESVLRDVVEGVYKNGIYDTIVLKMSKDNGDDLWTMGSFVATPEHEISTYWDKVRDGTSRHRTGGNMSSSAAGKSTVVPQWFQDHFDKNFGDVPGLSRLVQYMIREGELEPHPQYEFGNIDQVSRGRLILLGDAAHMASPRTAVGAHTAILDALALREAFQSSGNDVEQAIVTYSERGVEHAQQLYARSRDVSQQFVPAGGVDSVVSPAAVLHLDQPVSQWEL